MKSTKALKRLAKIDSLMADVAERFKGSPKIREALQDTRAALARIKAAVSSQASAEKAKASKARSIEMQKLAVQEGVEAIGNEETKAGPNRKKASKTIAAKTPAAMTAKRRTPIKRAPIKKKNAGPNKTAQSPVETPAIAETGKTGLPGSTAPTTVRRIRRGGDRRCHSRDDPCHRGICSGGC